MGRSEAKDRDCFCPYCESTLGRPFPFCKACGKKLKFCPKCGEASRVEAEQCSKCGSKFPAV